MDPLDVTQAPGASGSPLSRWLADARTGVGGVAWEDKPALGRPWIVRRWLLTRGLTLLLLVVESSVLGDVHYYARQLLLLAGTGSAADVLREYPAPAFAVFLPPWWLALGNHTAYLSTFVLLMVAVDACFTAGLWSASGRRATPGVRFWLWMIPCLGPLAFTRFDLVPAALAAAAVLALAGRRSGWAGVLLASGAAVKLWPAVLLPGLLIRRDRPGRVLAGFVGVGALAIASTVAAGGVTRVFSPLVWQRDRGLQVETIWAVPLLWARSVRPGTWSTPLSDYLAFEVKGPGTALLLTLSTVATVATLLLLCWLWLRGWRTTGPGQPASLALVGMLTLVATCLLIVPAKTLSPQYLLWIGAVLAALGAIVPEERLVPRLNVLVIITCLLTQLIYPLAYGMFTGANWSNAIGAGVLTLRNGLLLFITALATIRVIELTRSGPSTAG